MQRKAKKENEEIFTVREDFTCHYSQRSWLGCKGKFTPRKGKLLGDTGEQKVYYSLSILLYYFGCQPFCVTFLCIEYLKKWKHTNKSIANCSHSLKHFIDKGHSLLQAKCWIKMAGWKINQEKYRSSLTIFIGNSPLHIQNMHIWRPGIILPELISTVVRMQKERKSLPSS